MMNAGRRSTLIRTSPCRAEYRLFHHAITRSTKDLALLCRLLCLNGWLGWVAVRWSYWNEPTLSPDGSLLQGWEHEATEALGSRHQRVVGGRAAEEASRTPA
jgi:hypothetical protein